MFRSLILSGLLSLASILTAHAATGFTFKQIKVSKTTAPDATKVSIPFHFENKTKRTLKIARYDSACSCIGARVAKGKMEYAPGEKGLIVVDFALKNFAGKVEKTVMLWTTDDPANKPSSVMHVNLTIPELVKITPPTQFWQQGEAPTTKVFKIKINHTKPINISNLSGTNTNFTQQIKIIKPGKEYEIHVTPKDLSAPSYGMIRFSTDAKIKRFQSGRAFVFVKRKQ